ncbi:MAG: PD40 domain-containing protein [Chloroflexi bacterium]|nr:PD40 domain-containing protein [Chloroflexota bacterium]
MNISKRFSSFTLLLAFILVSCVQPQETPVVISTVTNEAMYTSTPTMLPSETPSPTISPSKTPRPTEPPSPTIPPSTLTAVATLQSLMASLINQYPELEKYGYICYPEYCYSIIISPDGQFTALTNVNVIELFRTNGQRIGTYPFYDLYGYQIDYRDGYVSVAHWSKDGKLLYIATSAGGDGGPEPYFGYESSLARVNLKDGTWEDTGISGVFSFSPTDQYIAYSTNESEIRILDLQSHEESIFNTEDYYQFFSKFVWSPDGRRIIFAATPEHWYEEGTTATLYMIDLDNETLSKVYEAVMPFYYPVRWTEANKVILNLEGESGEWTLDLSVSPPQITSSQ